MNTRQNFLKHSVIVLGIDLKTLLLSRYTDCRRAHHMILGWREKTSTRNPCRNHGEPVCMLVFITDGSTDILTVRPPPPLAFCTNWLVSWSFCRNAQSRKDFSSFPTFSLDWPLSKLKDLSVKLLRDRLICAIVSVKASHASSLWRESC